MSATTTPPYLPLKGKTAMITGASRGIGAGIALELANRGANIIIVHRPGASSIGNTIVSLPHRPAALTVCVDLSDANAAKILMEPVEIWLKNHGLQHIDILVNNAAVEVVKPLGDITPTDFAKVYDLNVRAPLLLTQKILPYLPDKGRIVNISSVGGRAGFAELGLYCSSKAALEGLTRCWAKELGLRGITVNAVCPGPVESEMLANIPKDIVDGQKKSTPVENRVGTVEEVAGVVAMLCGKEGSWISGQCINVSGGWTMY